MFFSTCYLLQQCFTFFSGDIHGNRRFTLLFVFFIMLSGQQVFAQYYLRKSGDPVIGKLTEKYRNRKLDLYELNEIVKEVSKNGSFQEVFVESISGDEVIIRTKKLKKMIQMELVGHSFFSREEIIKKMKLEEGQAPSQSEISQALNRIHKLYEESGFYNFEIVQSRKFNEEKQGYILTLHIREGKYCVIENINIFSENKKLNDRLRLKLSEFVGDPYKRDMADFFQKKIESELFENRYLVSKISNTSLLFKGDKTSVRINFTISNPIQFEFVFYGDRFFSHFDLIRESKIKDNKSLSLNSLSAEMMEGIKQLYLISGFPKMKIQFSEETFKQVNKKVFLFKIDEGPRIRIGKVNILGKISKKKSYYTGLFFQSLREQPNSVYFVKDNIQLAAQAMITQLKRKGHFQAELISLTSQFKNNNRIDIDLKVDEGIPTYIRQVIFQGSKSFSNGELTEQVGIQVNEPVRVSLVEESFEKLIRFYKNKAFLEFKIKNKDSSVIRYSPDQPYVDIVYEVEEGPKIKVSDIIIKGNRKTKNYILLRELDFEKKQYLTLDKLTSSIENLEQTGLFSKINIHSMAPENSEESSESKKEKETLESERDIVVEVEERKPGLFSSGIGLLSQGRLTYRGYMGVLYNNLLGKARGISGRADLRYQEGVNYLENRLMLSYYEPFIFKNRIRGRVSLVREQELFDFRENNSDILSTNEIRFSLEKEFSTHFRLAYNLWRFSNQETFNVNDKKPRKPINIGSTGPAFEVDYRDDPFLPTQGGDLRFQVEYSDPVFGSSRDNPKISGRDPNTLRPLDPANEVHYHKSFFSTTYYNRLTENKRWIWVNSLRGGYLKNISRSLDSGIPKVRSFFLGGSSTIRGFAIGTTETVPGKRELCLKQNIINKSQPTDQCRFDDVFVRDDSAFFLVKSELRFPFIGPFGGLVFYDGGAVYLGEFKLQDPYRDSVGFGLHYDTPVGSFVIQMGYKLDRKTGGLETNYDKESSMAFHLAIGTF